MSKISERPDVWSSGTCRINAIDIHYRRTGGDKPPLVVLHGLIGSGACLLPLVHGLEDRFDVILPDARGHGASSSPETGYLYGDLAGDVIALVDALKLEAPILAGHSMGGMTAAVAASKLGVAARALVLIDPTFISPEWQREVYESDVAADHRRSLQSTRNELLDQARLKNASRSAELIEHLVDARLHTSLSAFEILTPPNPDWRELVRNIPVPMLLLIGDGGVVSLDIARELHGLNPLLQYEVIADAGHGMPYDKPAHVSGVMRAFLEQAIMAGEA